MAEIIYFVKPETGKWLVDVILWLVSVSGSVWLGVILFTLALKLITLPFDFFSRASMRKNSIKMEEMRPELEKLQKQYANDKALYNQKMMALYKKNGYSMWGSCLPTILTLVIFIVAINAFTSYSNYQNRQYFYEMSQSFNSVVYDAFDEDGTYITKNAEGELVLKDKELFEKAQNGESVISTTDAQGNAFDIIVSLDADGSDQNDAPDGITVTTTNSYMLYHRLYDGTAFRQIDYSIKIDKLQDSGLEVANKSFDEYKTTALASDNTLTEQKIAEKFILEIQQTKSAETFRNVNASFLWVKNIWVTDSPTKHPIETNWDSFKQSYGYEDGTGFKKVDANDYANLIAKLDKEKTQPNGYFILVALTVITTLLSQIVMSKSQKAQMELQTVDGQGAQTNKIMMWMMPIMMAIFSFMYTAAFALYIVLSSVFSLLTTFLINYVVGKRYKKEMAEVQEKNKVIRGRVYTPPKEEPKQKQTRKEKKNAIPDNDFLSGKADRKPRGRIK